MYEPSCAWCDIGGGGIEHVLVRLWGVRVDLHTHTQIPMKSRHVALGQTLLLPHTYHSTLAIILLVLGLLLVAPSWFLAKKAITFLVGFVVVQFALPLLLLAERLASTPLVVRAKAWLPVSRRFHDLVMVTSIVAALLDLYLLVNLALGLGGCTTYTTTSLYAYITSIGNPSTPTDWNGVLLNPDFATQIVWYQLCLQDYALTVGFLVVVCVCIVLDILVLIQWMMAPGMTLRVYARMGRRMRPPSPAAPQMSSAYAPHQDVPLPLLTHLTYLRIRALQGD